MKVQTSSSVGTAAVTWRPGWSVIRKASPAASGSASEERVRAPVATKTCCRGSSGSVTVSPRPAGRPRTSRRRRRSGPRRPVRPSDRHQLASGRSRAPAAYAGSRAGLVGRQPGLDEPGRPGVGPAISAAMPDPAREHLPPPGPTAAGCPSASACTSAPATTQVTISTSACGCSSKPAPGAEQVVVVATSGPKPTSRGRSARRTRRSAASDVPPRGSRTVPNPCGSLRSRAHCAVPSPDRPSPAARRLPLRHQHRVVPDRGRGHRGRQGPQHLGHLLPRSRGGSPTAPPATWRATTTTGSTRTSR